MVFLCVGCELARYALGSEPIASARYGATDCAQDPEDHTDDNQDGADCVQDAEVWNKKSDDDQDNAEDDHDDSVQLVLVVWWKSHWQIDIAYHCEQ
jgi:hypothetical protein